MGLRNRARSFACYTKDNSCSNAELVLPIALEVAQLRVVVIGLDSSDPYVFRDSQIDATSYGHGKGGIVAGGQLPDGCRKVAVEAVYAAKQGLSIRL